MAQILIMGASTVYGVGGAHGGWADLIKLHLHERMYSGNTTSEAHEVHIFAKPDATVQFIVDTHSQYIADYRRDKRKTIVVLSIGMNDTKAIDSPDNYLNTPENYQKSMADLIGELTAQADFIICVGFAPVDETKTSPKLNPFTGKNSYFSNERIEQFNAAFAAAADMHKESVSYIDLASRLGNTWTEKYLSSDGLHPNDKGHQCIFEIVIPEINRLIST